MFLRRKLKWFGVLCRAGDDLISKKPAMEVRGFFEPLLFGTDWDQAQALAQDEIKWNEFMDDVVEKHAFRAPQNVEVNTQVHH